jgi:cysteinyl-tRNA synthetase, unknown class
MKSSLHKLFVIISSAMLLLVSAGCSYNKTTLSEQDPTNGRTETMASTTCTTVKNGTAPEDPTSSSSTGNQTTHESETSTPSSSSETVTTHSATAGPSTHDETELTTQTTAETAISTEPAVSNSYRIAMIDFVSGISSYAKQLNQNFLVIPQNGEDIVDVDSTSSRRYFNAIDGIGREDFLYGYNQDNVKTPASDTKYILSFLNKFKAAGKSVLITDYCSSSANMLDSYSTNNSYGFISFAADDRELRTIPDYPNPVYNENANNAGRLSEIANFLYIINPDRYSSKDAFVNAVANTNYDLVILDLFYDSTPLTQADLAKIKTKPNGGTRLAICYMSIGEAEDYRYYWKSEWKSSPPPWLGQENPDWAGNYIVRYWDLDWQKIFYGNDTSYVRRILNAGFDGVYLDIIDAYEYYESR